MSDLSCARCGDVADARSRDVMVCEACFGRFHAECWSAPCACGASSAFGPIGKLDVARPLRAVQATPRPARRGRAAVALALVALGVVSIAALASRRPVERVSRAELIPEALGSDRPEAAPAQRERCSFARARFVASEAPTEIAELTRTLESHPELAECWVTRGWLRLMGGDEEGALADCARAVALPAHGASDWNNRGYLRALVGDFAGGVADCSRAIELCPLLPHAWNNRGYARMHLGDLEGARADIERSLALDSENPYAWENRGHVRRLAGDTEGAAQDFTKCLEIDTDGERKAAVIKALYELYGENRQASATVR